jgi:hypothetical protein
MKTLEYAISSPFTWHSSSAPTTQLKALPLTMPDGMDQFLCFPMGLKDPPQKAHPMQGVSGKSAPENQTPSITD